MPMLPKPFVINETLPITFNEIIRRIQLQDEMKLLRYHLQIPKNRRAPKSELQNHRDELPDIAQKNRQRTCQPTQSQRQTNHREEVINYLQVVNCRRITVNCEHDEQYRDKKNVHDECRHNFYNRQQLNAEDDFFHEERAFCHRIRRTLYALAQEKPWEHSAYQPQNEREIIHGDGFKTDLEDEPEYKNRNCRLNERP